MNLAKKVSRNIFSNMAGMLVGLVISFFLAPIVVHGLGNTYYGIWVIMMQLTGYLWLFDLGIKDSIVRYVAKHQAEKKFTILNEVVSTAVYIYIFISIGTVLASIILAYFFPYIFNVQNNAVNIARIVLILTGVNVAQGWIFNIYFGVLKGLQRFDIFNKTGIAFAVLRFVLIVIFLHFGYGIITLGVIQLVINFSWNLVIFIKCKQELPELKLIPYAKEKMQYKLIVNYSVFVLINNVGQKIIFFTSALIIGIFLPASAITFYAIPGSLIDYMRKIVMAMTRVLNPLTSELEAINEGEKIKSVLINGTKFSLLIGLPISVTYFILGKLFISLWMGPEYAEESAGVLLVLSVTHSFSLVHYTINQVLYGISRHKIMAYFRIIEAVFNLSLSIILINYYGIVGVALGMAIPHVIFMVIIMPVKVCKILSVTIVDYIKSAILPAIVSIIPFACGCYMVSIYYPANSLLIFFIEIFCLLPFYALSTWFLGFNKSERISYKKLIKSFIPAFNN